ncbi:hypothetical protein [Paraburkholderia bryophila]|uniref:Uncharacterized protein n=1 Tax=Paraburkholderia bryophila TaxID=420952 RepID=A0A329BJR2_9BURK|nr:hypothetical protein [Paraburkholderia bryophila]RAS21511.1 hypothetical protein BX591_12830 [Paraburkholderia bryophila]
MVLEELNQMIADAKLNKPASPQMDVTELCATFRTTLPVVSKWAAAGAPVNLNGQTDLFALFGWLHVHQDHPYLPSVGERLIAQWKISLNV